MDADVIRAQSAAEGWWSRGRTEIVEQLLPPSGDGLRVLDVGAGWGSMSETLQAWGDLVAIDPSPAAREEAASRGIEVLDGRAEALPVDDASVDLALACDVIEHLPDDVAAVRELARVLRPGGTALLTVPAYPWLMGAHDRAVGHERRYTQRALLQTVTSAGLEPQRVTHFNTLLFPLAVPRRLLSRFGEPRAESLRAPGPLDAIFFRTFRSERRLLSRFNLPFGLSLAVLATRPGEVGET